MGSEGGEAAEEFQSELCHHVLLEPHWSLDQVLIDSSPSFGHHDDMAGAVGCICDSNCQKLSKCIQSENDSDSDWTTL